MKVAYADYQQRTRKAPGHVRTIEIERPDDLSGSQWHSRFRDLAAGVFRQAVHDLCTGSPAHRADALAFLTATPDSTYWPLFEHWWGYLDFSSLRRFHARVRAIAKHPDRVHTIFSHRTSCRAFRHTP